MRKLILLTLVTLLSCSVLARQAVVNYSAPQLRCDGTPVITSEIDSYEIYVSETSMGLVALETCGTAPVPAIAPITLPGDTTSYEIQFDAGKTYYIAIRVRDMDGLWSQFTDELKIDIPASQLLKPTLQFELR